MAEPGIHHDGKEDYLRWQDILAEKGWLVHSWPVEHGGTGWSPVQRYIFEEEMGRANAPRIIPFGPKMVGPVICTFGDDAQKARYLPAIARNETWWCQGYSEPDAGSDLASLRTRAIRDGDHYVVNGTKTWTTLAHWADMMFCLVRTDPKPNPRRESPSCSSTDGDPIHGVERSLDCEPAARGRGEFHRFMRVPTGPQLRESRALHQGASGGGQGGGRRHLRRVDPLRRGGRPEGAGGSWIVKLPAAGFEGVPENEFSMMSLAARLGLDVPEIRLVDLDAVAGLPEGVGPVQGKALAVRRFDRAPDGARVHAEDFAQVFGLYPERKYERGNYRSIAEVVWVEAGEPGIVEFVRRLVFNALIGNADMHMKNWSLIYPDGRSAALAPAYDLLSTIAYIPDGKMALNLVRSKRFADLTVVAFTHFAGKARLPERPVLSAVRETAERFQDEWPAARRELPVTERVARAIDDHLEALPLANGR